MARSQSCATNLTFAGYFLGSFSRSTVTNFSLLTTCALVMMRDPAMTNPAPMSRSMLPGFQGDLVVGILRRGRNADHAFANVGDVCGEGVCGQEKIEEETGGEEQAEASHGKIGRSGGVPGGPHTMDERIDIVQRTFPRVGPKTKPPDPVGDRGRGLGITTALEGALALRISRHEPVKQRRVSRVEARFFHIHQRTSPSSPG